MNDKNIYQLDKNKPIIIPLANKHSKIVVTDGYHYTKSLELAYHQIHTYYFKVVCAINDEQLALGAILLSLFYFAGLTSGIIFMQVISVLPILYFLYWYYINRNDFLQIKSITSL